MSSERHAQKPLAPPALWSPCLAARKFRKSVPAPVPTNRFLHCWAIICDIETTSPKLCAYLICYWESFKTELTVSPDFLTGKAFHVCELEGATNLVEGRRKTFQEATL